MYREISEEELKIDKTLGYVYFVDSKHPLAHSSNGKVYYHRHVASVKENRWIEKYEVVHHKDENRVNNSPDNLEVMSLSKHAAIHMAIKIKNNGWEFSCLRKYTCEYCKKDFELNSRDKKGEKVFCSMECFRLNSRKVERPSKEQLAQMLEELPKTKIAEIYGVSDKSIEKWAKSMGLKTKPRGYWAKQNKL